MPAIRHLWAAGCTLALAALLAAPLHAADVDKLLPNDTETVASVNLKQILESPLAKKLPLDMAKDALKQNEEIQKTLTELGFDPFKDIDSITVAGAGGSDADRMLVIVRGKFEVEKFDKKAEDVAKDMKDQLKIHKVPGAAEGAGSKLYEVTNPNGQPEKVFVAFASKGVLVASPAKDYVLDALEKEAGKKKTALKNKDLAELLGRVDATKYSVWTVILGSTLENSPLAQEDAAKEMIAKVQDVIAGIVIDKDVKAEAVITAKGTQDAKD